MVPLGLQIGSSRNREGTGSLVVTIVCSKICKTNARRSLPLDQKEYLKLVSAKPKHSMYGVVTYIYPLHWVSAKVWFEVRTTKFEAFSRSTKLSSKNITGSFLPKNSFFLDGFSFARRHFQVPRSKMTKQIPLFSPLQAGRLPKHIQNHSINYQQKATFRGTSWTVNLVKQGTHYS